MVWSCARQVGDRSDLHQLGGSSRRAGRRGKYPSSANSLWEYLMLNSSGSLNGLAKRYGVPNRKLRIALRENSSTTHQNRAWAPPLDLADIKSSPAITPTMTRADRQNTGTWPSIFTFLTEGLALYGASYGALVSGIATPPTEASARRPEKSSPCERRKFISIVSPQRVLG